MALKPRKLAEEAARGALKAVHASAGLSRHTSSEASGLLRAAEGLVRAAVAVLQSPASTGGAAEGGKHPAVASVSGPEPTRKPPGGGTSRAARRRRRRRKEKDEGMEEALASGGAQESVGASAIASASAVVVASGVLAESGVTSVQTSDQILAVGDSVFVGDLSEFGIPQPQPLPQGLPLSSTFGSRSSFVRNEARMFKEAMASLPFDVQLQGWKSLGYNEEDSVMTDIHGLLAELLSINPG